jgi:hypothetical protein
VAARLRGPFARGLAEQHVQVDAHPARRTGTRTPPRGAADVVANASCRCGAPAALPSPTSGPGDDRLARKKAEEDQAPGQVRGRGTVWGGL